MLSKEEHAAVLAERARVEKETTKKADEELFQQPLDTCLNGELPGPVAIRYGVNPKRLRRHFEAALAGNEVTRGRNPILSASALDKLLDKALQGDLRKNSKGSTDWDTVITGAAASQSKSSTLRTLDPKTLRKYRDKIVPHVTKQGYNQNQARFDALRDPYSQIAFCIILRGVLGYHTSTSSLGRSVDETPPLRNPDFFHNADGSSLYP